MDSSVTIATSYKLENQHLIPGTDKIYFSSQCPNQPWGPLKPPSKWILGDLFLGIDHSPPSNTKIKNGGADAITVPSIFTA
jgi:hypothetical protein